MRPRHDLPLDLNDCILEDRVLMAYGPGLMGSAFFANTSTNSMVVPGTNAGSGGPGGGSASPGPQFYNLLVGLSLSSTGALGPGSGGTISLYSRNLISSTTLGTGNSMLGGGGGRAGSGGGGGSSGRAANASGFGGNFSSGFSFALGTSNNYGMSANTVGSVPVHTFGNGGDPVPEAPQQQNNPGTMPNQNPMNPPNNGMMGVNANPNNLLGKSPSEGDTPMNGVPVR